jgi:monoamine oxidase
MAAWSLESAGMSVTVFEAAGRVGGRVRTNRALVPGKVVEAGAELVGENHPTFLALARKFGLSLVRVSKDKDYEARGLKYRVRFGNTDLSAAELRVIDRELHRVWTIIAREAAPVDAQRPWRSPDAAALDTISLAQRLDRPPDLFGPASSNARRYFELVAQNDQCAPVDRQSYLGYLAAVKAHTLPGDPLAYWTRTETHRCKGGNDQLGVHLAKGLRDLRLNAPVTWVEIGSQSVQVRFGTAGLHEDFDYIVLATAPKVWPKIHAPTSFRPDEYTMASGPAVKFLSGFERPFWEDRKLAPSALWDQLGSVWEGTDKQRGRTAHCLSVYSGGGLVLDSQRYQDRLEDLYPGFRSSLKGTLFVDWPNEPWVRAGYSVPAPGQVTTIAKNLSSPFAGRLYFAGEQASPGFFGYMEGALTSGMLAACRIVAAARLTCRVASTGTSGGPSGRSARIAAVSAAVPQPVLAP